LRRRFLVEVEVADTVPDALLDTLMQLAGKLEEMKKKDDLIDYGIALEYNFTWFVRTAAEAEKHLEEAEK